MGHMKRVSCPAAVAALVALIPATTLDAQASHPDPRVAANIPADVEIPDGFAGNPIAFFDDYSWRIFVALNWPAKDAARGEPDRDKNFGATADNVVWDTSKADHELFQPGGMPPSIWESFDAISPDSLAAFRASAAAGKVLGGFGAGSSELQIDHFNQAGPGIEIGSLTSRNRQYVRYEVRMNRTFYEFVRAGNFYLFANLPIEGQLVFPTGSIEIKAAWRRFTEAELGDTALLKGFYTRRAVLVDPDGSRQEALVGLIGLHIVHRTPSRPEWIWSTFEHVDNDQGDEPTFVIAATGAEANKLLPVVNDQAGHGPDPDPEPVPVRREKPIHTSTLESNRLYVTHPGVRDTVWANYRLVMTQWPVNPAASEEDFVARFDESFPEGAGTPFPENAGSTAISNLTMETTGAFQSGFSCMHCHFLAGSRRHTEFVWTVPLRAWRPTTDKAVTDARKLRLEAARILEAAGVKPQQP